MFVIIDINLLKHNLFLLQFPCARRIRLSRWIFCSGFALIVRRKCVEPGFFMFIMKFFLFDYFSQFQRFSHKLLLFFSLIVKFQKYLHICISILLLIITISWLKSLIFILTLIFLICWHFNLAIFQPIIL